MLLYISRPQPDGCTKAYPVAYVFPLQRNIASHYQRVKSLPTRTGRPLCRRLMRLVCVGKTDADFLVNVLYWMGQLSWDTPVRIRDGNLASCCDTKATRNGLCLKGPFYPRPPD
jgi:hypothetical protein